MKKIAAGLLSLSLLLSVGSFSVFAAGPSCLGLGAARGTLAGQGFVDADGDGVCDNWTAGRGGGFVDADGDGVCDNWPAGRGMGRNAGGRGQFAS